MNKHVAAWLQMASRHKGPTKRQKQFVDLVVAAGNRISHEQLAKELGDTVNDAKDRHKSLMIRINKRLTAVGSTWKIAQDRGEVTIMRKSIKDDP